MTKNKQRQAFLDAIAANPRDQAPRLIYADWLREQGDEAEANRQTLKARQCLRFDPDFDYDNHLHQLGFGRRLHPPRKVRADVLGCGEIIRLSDGDGHSVFCSPSRLQSWLVRQVRAVCSGGFPTSPEQFWATLDDWPQASKAMMRRAFEASSGRTWYVLSDTSWEFWPESWCGSLVKRIGPGCWVERISPKEWDLWDQDQFDGMQGDGWLCSRREYEEARRERCTDEELEGEDEG